MNSPRLGGRGRGSMRGTPRMGTPMGSSGGFAAPAPKGSLMLGKAKERLRAGLDQGSVTATMDQSQNAMLLSREGSIDDGDLSMSRAGGPHSSERRGGSEKGKLFAKSEEMTVAWHEGMPLEILKAMGIDGESLYAWKEAYTGGYDTATGYSWLASCRNTWAWKHSRNLSIPPTVHIFASPPTADDLSPPQVLFLPLQANSSNEPALLLISSTGHIRFWSSIYLGLAGADRFVQASIMLQAKTSETVSMAQALVPSVLFSDTKTIPASFVHPAIVLGTSAGRLFRIVISRRGESGDWLISSRQIQDKQARSSSLFSGLFGFGAPPATSPIMAGDNKFISSIAIGRSENNELDVWVLDATDLSVWRVSEGVTASTSDLNGVERRICSADALSGVQEKLLELYGLASPPGDEMMMDSPGGGMAGGLPMQMERKERQILALNAELLDMVLVRRKNRPMDPREPSVTPGSRSETDMQTETNVEVEEITAVMLVGYNAPSERSEDMAGISWGSIGGSKKNIKRRERSYATIACRFIGADMLAGSQPSPINLQGAVLRLETPVSLPYSDFGTPRSGNAPSVARGVSLAFGMGKLPGSREIWFPPRLVSLQATVTLSPSDEDVDEEFVPKEMSVTTLAATFEGGMVFAANDGPFKDHLFMKQSHPFPRSVGIGIVNLNPSVHPLYSLTSGRLSASTLVRPASRSQMLPPPSTQVPYKASTGEIAYMTTMGIVTVTLDFEKIASVDERSGGANQIRSVMEQAILYGPVQDNPFTFRFSSNVNAGHLMIAASQLSLETLESSPRLIKRQLGLTTHLADRAARLEWLIQFINENGALNRLNIPLRATLATHAEKIAAAQGVWAWYENNRYKGPSTAAGLGSVGLERSENMLAQAVEIFQEEEESADAWPTPARIRRKSRPQHRASPTSSVGAMDVSLEDDGPNLDMSWTQVARPGNAGAVEPGTEDQYVDPVRVFFKIKVEDISELVPCAVKVVKSVVNSFDKARSWPDVTTQAGRLALVLLEAALEFRRLHFSAYGLDLERPTAVPWTSEQRILDACMYLFEECSRMGPESSTGEAKDVMEGLATVICEGYKEKLAATKLQSGADWESVQDRFISTRRKVWKLLVQRGAAQHAFKLAEEYGDYRALTELCYQFARKKKKETNGQVTTFTDREELQRRIEHYLSTFKQEFAFELYQYWIEKKTAHDIFKQAGSHAEYVEAFFATYDHPNLAWLYQIGKQRFSAASATLLGLSQSETQLPQLKFMLSMGKLCEIAENADDEDENVLAFDNQLDLVDIQRKLRNELLENIADVDIASALSVADIGSQNEDILAKAAAITERVTTQIGGDGFIESVAQFKRLIGNLVDNKRLDLEDTLDILALKDYSSEADGFSIALHLIFQTRLLTDAQKEMAFCSLWRRVYIRDNWKRLHDTRSLTDGEVNERLRGTVLYSALRNLYTSSMAADTDADQLSKLVRRPSDALELPTEEELADRYSQAGYYGESGYTKYGKGDVSALYQELEKERDTLEQYFGILEGGGLWDEIARLEESERPIEDDGEILEEDQSTDIRGNSLGIEVDMA